MLFKKYSTLADNRLLDSSYSAIKRYVNKMIYMPSSLSCVFFARGWYVCKDKARFTEFKYMVCTIHTVCPYFLVGSILSAYPYSDALKIDAVDVKLLRYLIDIKEIVL